MQNDFRSHSTRSKMKMTYRLVLTGILAAVSIVLMFFETPLPFMPPFLKFDLSDIPALFAAFVLGPVYAIVIEAVKNIFHLPTSGTMYVGELANFLAGSFFTGTAGLIYQKLKSPKKAIWSFAGGIIVTTIFTSFFNYFFLLDFYANLFAKGSMDAIISMGSAMNFLVQDTKTMIVFAFVPFNLFKGIVVSVITGFLYWRLAPVLKSNRFQSKKNQGSGI